MDILSKDTRILLESQKLREAIDGLLRDLEQSSATVTVNEDDDAARGQAPKQVTVRRRVA
jgi:hypothetical protein